MINGYKMIDNSKFGSMVTLVFRDKVLTERNLVTCSSRKNLLALITFQILNDAATSATIVTH